MNGRRNEMSELLARLQKELPVVAAPFPLAGHRCGLVVIDEQNGFATVGAGPLAPTEPNEQITRMISETDRLARLFEDRHLPIAVFLDWHATDRPEPPYPLHCLAGTAEAEAELVPELAWLADSPVSTVLRADCINDFVGSIDPETGRNAIVEWVTGRQIDTLVVVGICTDICVGEFVATMLSARNHRLMPPLRDVVRLRAWLRHLRSAAGESRSPRPAGDGGPSASRGASPRALVDGIARRRAGLGDPVINSRFFFYGTLMDPLILRTVLRRDIDRRRLRRAVLPRFRRVFHRGASYPVLVADNASEVNGILASGLTQRDAALLVRYEGPEYRLVEEHVRIGGSTVVAAVFLPQRDAVASTMKWTYEEWRRRFRARFLRQVGHRRAAPVADRRFDGATALQRR